MPKLWVRKDEAWKEVTDATRAYVRRNERWDLISSIRVQQLGNWPLALYWSPPAPTNLRIRPGSEADTAQAKLDWDAATGAVSYRVTQTEWNPDKVTIKATLTKDATTTGVTMTGLKQKTHYSFEVQSIGEAVGGQPGAISALSNTLRWKTGNAAVMGSTPVYGWSATEYSGLGSGMSSWTTTSNIAETWDNSYPPARATNGTGAASTWGWLMHQNHVQQCWIENPSSVASGRIDIRGYKTVWPPILYTKPPGKIKINYYSIGHRGHRGNRSIYPGFTAFSRARAEYGIVKVNSANTVLRTYVSKVGVDGTTPGNNTWQSVVADYPKTLISGTEAQRTVDGPAGEKLACYLLEYPPLGVPEPYGVPDSLGNIRYLRFWWNNWEIVGYQSYIIEAATNSTGW